MLERGWMSLGSLIPVAAPPATRLNRVLLMFGVPVPLVDPLRAVILEKVGPVIKLKDDGFKRAL